MQWFKKAAKSSQKELSKTELVSVYRAALVQGVELSKLNQKVEKMAARLHVTEQFEEAETTQRVSSINSQLPLFMKIGAFSLPIAFITVGFFLVGNAVVPLLGYYTSSVSFLADAELISPLPREQLLDVSPTVINDASGKANAYQGNTEETFQRPTFLDTQLDYTNLANWFSSADVAALTQQEGPVTEYIIDIPTLGIADAVVTVGGTNLDESLIQYPGTAEPGAAGAPVIFGHSVLRQFYNPSEQNPRRYISIFSKIMTLQPGDEIFVTYDGVKYKYIMQEKTEVKPEDVHILMQNYDSRQLKLVTCTPEGTYLRRGIVTAQLVTQ